MNHEPDAQVSKPGADAPGLFETFQYLSHEATAVSKELVALVGAELSLAVKSIPKLIATGAAALFLLITSWLSICVALAYGSYAVTGFAWLAFVSFAAIQLVALASCKFLITRLSRNLTLPYSREFFNDLQRGHHEPENKTS